MISQNSFAKDVPVKSVNSFADDKPVVSTKPLIKDAPTIGGYAWEGENLTGGPGLGSDISGASDIGEQGGIAHFQNRTQPTVNH